jgi:hypothetical protein
MNFMILQPIENFMEKNFQYRYPFEVCGCKISWKNSR